MGVEIRFLKWGFKLENKIKPRYKLSIFIDIVSMIIYIFMKLYYQRNKVMYKPLHHVKSQFHLVRLITKFDDEFW